MPLRRRRSVLRSLDADVCRWKYRHGPRDRIGLRIELLYLDHHRASLDFMGQSGSMESYRAIPQPRDGTGVGPDPSEIGMAYGCGFIAIGRHRGNHVFTDRSRAVTQGPSGANELIQPMRDAMKITPLDIQQMVFRVKLRGYDQEEVNRFLEEVAQTVEALNRDNATLRERTATLEQQVVELKRTEVTLSNTLVSAQSLADDVKRSAQRDAELIVKEAELKAEELFRQARAELASTQRDLTILQKQRLLMIERMRGTLHTFERMLDIETTEVYQDHAALQDEKLEDESSHAR